MLGVRIRASLGNSRTITRRTYHDLSPDRSSADHLQIDHLLYQVDRNLPLYGVVQDLSVQYRSYPGNIPYSRECGLCACGAHLATWNCRWHISGFCWPPERAMIIVVHEAGIDGAVRVVPSWDLGIAVAVSYLLGARAPRVFTEIRVRRAQQRLVVRSFFFIVYARLIHIIFKNDQILSNYKKTAAVRSTTVSSKLVCASCVILRSLVSAAAVPMQQQ